MIKPQRLVQKLLEGKLVGGHGPTLVLRDYQSQLFVFSIL